MSMGAPCRKHAQDYFFMLKASSRSAWAQLQSFSQCTFRKEMPFLPGLSSPSFCNPTMCQSASSTTCEFRKLSSVGHVPRSTRVYLLERCPSTC